MKKLILLSLGTLLSLGFVFAQAPTKACCKKNHSCCSKSKKSCCKSHEKTTTPAPSTSTPPAQSN